MADELKRLQVSLAQTEKMWRQERENAKMWKALFVNRERPHGGWCSECHKWKRIFCVLPCPPVAREQERMEA